VVEEVGHVLAAEVTDLWRYDEEGAAVFVASWTSGPPLAFPERLALDGVSVGRLVRDTGRPARIDDYGVAHAREPGTVTRTWGELGISAAIGCPVVVAGRTWGVMSACRLRGAPLPAGAEDRLASFTELVGTAIANATTYASLIASRARLVAAGDEARRRIERDLHDGTQQQLVSIGLDLQSLKLSLPVELAWAHAELDRIRGSLDSAVDEVREISRGLHPAILSQAGLGAALRTLARRSAVPATVDARLDAALPESVEIALYFVVAEALANAAKHAGATTVEIAVATAGERLTATIRDDGRGGAAVASGSGLAGIADRVEALGGTLQLTSPPGAGTTVEIELPLAFGPDAEA
jgi:signal transduction histidine kinase